jgi:hypothetical protein
MSTAICPPVGNKLAHSERGTQRGCGVASGVRASIKADARFSAGDTQKSHAQAKSLGGQRQRGQIEIFNVRLILATVNRGQIHRLRKIDLQQLNLCMSLDRVHSIHLDSVRLQPLRILDGKRCSQLVPALVTFFSIDAVHQRMSCRIVRWQRLLIRIVRIKETAARIRSQFHARNLPMRIVQLLSHGIVGIFVSLLPPELPRTSGQPGNAHGSQHQPCDKPASSLARNSGQHPAALHGRMLVPEHSLGK